MKGMQAVSQKNVRRSVTSQSDASADAKSVETPAGINLFAGCRGPNCSPSRVSLLRASPFRDLCFGLAGFIPLTARLPAFRFRE